MGKIVVPNSWQHLNFYSDKLDEYLTPEESKVFNRILREIFGWDTKIGRMQARLAISIFTHGKFNEYGEKIAGGVGLCRDAVVKALNNLERFGIIKRKFDPTDPLGQDGSMVSITIDDDFYDWPGLKKRLADKQADGKKRTEACRKGRKEKAAQKRTNQTYFERQEGML